MPRWKGGEIAWMVFLGGRRLRIEPITIFQGRQCMSVSGRHKMNQNAVATKFEIQVVYNGLTETLEVQSHEQVTAVLQRALNIFNITQDRQNFVFSRENGSEVPNDQSVSDSGIKPGELLLLRPRQVRGGLRC